MRTRTAWMSGLVLTALLATPTMAADAAAGKAPAGANGSSKLTMLTGFAWSQLQDQGDYRMIPVILQLPLAQSKDWPCYGEWTVNLEPYAGAVIQPQGNVELGLPIFLRYGLPLGSTGLKLFVEGGVGPMYMSQNTEEQGSDFNFIGQVGGGLRYALREHVDVELAYRFREITNAGLASPNDGISGHAVLIGITFRY